MESFFCSLSFFHSFFPSFLLPFFLSPFLPSSLRSSYPFFHFSFFPSFFLLHVWHGLGRAGCDFFLWCLVLVQEGQVLMVGEWSGAMATGNGNDTNQRKFADAQIQAYSHARGGWFFWTWKMGVDGMDQSPTGKDISYVCYGISLLACLFIIACIGQRWGWIDNFAESWGCAWDFRVLSVELENVHQRWVGAFDGGDKMRREMATNPSDFLVASFEFGFPFISNQGGSESYPSSIFKGEDITCDEWYLHHL